MLSSVLRRHFHLSLVLALIVAAPGVKASPSALSRVRLTPEIKAAHPAQSSRTSAHQNQKVTSSRHPFISGISAPIHLSLARFGTLPSFHCRHASSVPELVFLHQSAFGILDSARKIRDSIGGGTKSALALQNFLPKFALPSVGFILCIAVPPAFVRNTEICFRTFLGKSIHPRMISAEIIKFLGWLHQALPANNQTNISRDFGK